MFDVVNNDVTVGNYVVVFTLNDSAGESRQYDLNLEVLANLPPVFDNWQSNWEIKFNVNDDPVVYNIPVAYD